MVLLNTLRERFSDHEEDLIFEEFRCVRSRIDVAVVNGALHGYEIKSDSDNLFRLPTQIEDYSAVFDFVTLVCGKSLLSTAQEIAPRWWGISVAAFEGSAVHLTPIRDPKQNPRQKRKALAQLLWKPEALHCLRIAGETAITSRHSAERVKKEVARKLDTRTLADSVRRAIKERGVSESAMPSIQDGDSCTIGSIETADHYSANLARMLSMLSVDHPR
jgi:hypothetical protein